MTWLAWRTQRLQILTAAACVAAFGIWLIVQGVHEHTLLNCLLSRIHPAGAFLYCSAASRAYDVTHWNPYFKWAMYVIPGLLGLLIGAPLVAREIEHGTNRLVWSQSIPRSRWLAIKLLVAGSGTVVVVSALELVTNWWHGEIAFSTADILPVNFDTTGFVAIGYALCAFMLGAALGALFRRTGWALLAGIPLFAALRVLVRFDIRSHLAGTVSVSANPYGSLPNSLAADWVVHDGFLPMGRMSPGPGRSWSSLDSEYYRCLASPSRYLSGLDPQYQQAARACLLKDKIHYVVAYQPASHYWALQTAETAIYVAVAAVLCAVTVLAVKRWRT